MGKYNFLYKYFIVSALMVFPISYSGAEESEDTGAFGFAAPNFIPSKENFSEWFDDRFQGAKDYFGKELARSHGRFGALRFTPTCDSLGGNSNGKDIQFCDKAQSEIRGYLVGQYAGIIDEKVREKIIEKIKECRTLDRVYAQIKSKIQDITTEIKSIDGQIASVVAKLEEPDLTGIAGADDDEKTKKFYEARRRELDSLEYKAKLFKSNIEFLKTGTGEPPYERDGPNLSYIKKRLDDYCGPVVVRPSDFGEQQTGSRLQVKYDPVMPATKAEIEVEVASEIVEPAAEVDVEKERISQAVTVADTQADSAITLIQGTVSRKGEVTGVIPQINQAREIIAAVEVGLRRGGGNLDNNDGVCVGLDCSTEQPPVAAPPVVAAAPPTQRGPNDGAAYGGNNPSDPGKKDTTTDNTGVMAKTSGNNGSGGFNMPSLGGLGSGTGGSKTDYNSPTYYAKTDINNGNAPSGFTRNWNGGSNAFNGLNNNTGTANRGPSSTDSGSGTANAGFLPAGNNGASHHGGGAGGAAGNLTGQSGGDGTYYASSSKVTSRPDKKGNKQLYTAKDEKVGSTSLAAREQARRAALGARMDKLKTESKLAGKDAFDPDKYIPKTAAERLALARASGKLGGLQADGKEWPKDISRLRNQSIFNLMGNGYQKQFK
ncbi:MAG: hypothetical protein M9899_10810 [Bdellovibrionaceae bacterium]|nr:hypothetical protein [Pseudobdellovibrionaceae bacterium]